jgi:hypothetical protein
MSSQNITKTAVFAMCLMFGGSADAFVGQIVVGLGQLNEVGQIDTAFAADAKVETEEMNINTKIFYKPGKLRDEMSVGGQEMVMIRRFDLNKLWMIMGQGMYMDIDPDGGSDQAEQYTLIEREVIGPETINGMQTTKYKSVYESKDGKFGGFTWFTDDNIAVKAFMIHETKGEKQRIKFEITDLRRGSQSDSIFEIPAGYQQFNMGGFGGMPNPGAMSGAGAYGSQGQATYGISGQSPAVAEESGITNEVADAAVEGAEEAAVEETKKGVKDSVSKGIRSLFGK